MTEQEKNYLVKFVESFLNDELGNRITKWNGNAFVQTFNVEIEKIYQKYKLEEDKKNEKNDENASVDYG